MPAMLAMPAMGTAGMAWAAAVVRARAGLEGAGTERVALPAMAAASVSVVEPREAAVAWVWVARALGTAEVATTETASAAKVAPRAAEGALAAVERAAASKAAAGPSGRGPRQMRRATP